MTTGVRDKLVSESFVRSIFSLRRDRFGARSEEEIDIASVPLGRRELLDGEVHEACALE